MDEVGDTIGLDYFQKLDPEIRGLVLQLRSDLRSVGLSIENRQKRPAGSRRRARSSPSTRRSGTAT
jgi:hypothetical protein